MTTEGARAVSAELGEVQETLLIPLYARAVETSKPDGILADPRAVEMVDAIDYDFRRFDGVGSLTGANLRTLVLDEWVGRFLDESPDGTVVEIGTGLNTRFERVDNGRVHWFDLDLPDAIALRREFFADSPRRRMIAASVADEWWIEEVTASPGPYLFVAEAVLAFLDEADVRRAFSHLAAVPDSTLVVDTAGGSMLRAQDSPDVLGTVAARMRWQCDDPAVPEAWHPRVRLEESIDFATLPTEVWARLSPTYQAAVRGFVETDPERSKAYRINRYRLG